MSDVIHEDPTSLRNELHEVRDQLQEQIQGLSDRSDRQHGHLADKVDEHYQHLREQLQQLMIKIEVHLATGGHQESLRRLDAVEHDLRSTQSEMASHARAWRAIRWVCAVVGALGLAIVGAIAQGIKWPWGGAP